MNCNYKHYMNVLRYVRYRHRRMDSYSTNINAELDLLSNPSFGLIPEDSVKGTENGRRVQPCMWVMATRARNRGKLGLNFLRKHPDPLKAQDELLSKLEAACPTIFAGLTVDEPST